MPGKGSVLRNGKGGNLAGDAKVVLSLYPNPLLGSATCRVGLESPNSVFSSWNTALHEQRDPLAILRALLLLYFR